MKNLMVKGLIVCYFLILLSFTETEEWSETEKEKANTAAEVSYLNGEEKELILYLNLARLYPKKYAELELVKEENKNTLYYKSLKKTLEAMDPVGALEPDAELSKTADCLRKDMYRFRYSNHTRVTCKGDYNGECLSFGWLTGAGHILNLLVDEGIKDLGHRKIMLAKGYKTIGTAVGKHHKYEESAVLDFGL
ncbi:MAG: hypothetical protein KDC92_03535 [Bacteroidetes bacterium]|nr:hypothetical protein [Bacteroidota bacterium]